jgi:biopolymer transport protein ExbD
MKLKRKKAFEAEVFTTSLNDIMFFLLLFFLIISTLSNPNVIKILLPRAQSSQAMNKAQINLSVTEDKKYFIDQKQIPFSKISPELKVRTRGLESPTIVLQIGNSLGIKMVLATQKE